MTNEEVKIYQFEDNKGNKIAPKVPERAVVDSKGVTLDQKLEGLGLDAIKEAQDAAIAAVEASSENLSKNVGLDEYETFSDQKAYSAGDTVKYNGLLYTFTTDHVAGAWDESQIESASLKGEVESEVNKLESVSNIFLSCVRVDETDKIEPYIINNKILTKDGNEFEFSNYNIYYYENTDANLVHYLQCDLKNVNQDSFINVGVYKDDNFLHGFVSTGITIIKIPKGIKVKVCISNNNTYIPFVNSKIVSLDNDINSTNKEINNLYNNLYSDVPLDFFKISGYYQKDNLAESTQYETCVFNIENYNECYLSTLSYLYRNYYTLLDADFIVSSYNLKEDSVIENETINLAGAKYIAVTHKIDTDYPIVKVTQLKIISNIKYNTSPYISLRNKLAVWFGTSIPAGRGGKGEDDFAYPQIVGEILNMRINNQAVGESSIHARSLQRITTENPYGFEDNWIKCAKCLTNSIEQTQWLIDHKDDTYLKDGVVTNIFTTNRPDTLTEKDKEFYLSCSYENKIEKLFDKDPIDFWIFDHGHNDRMDANKDPLKDWIQVTDEEIILDSDGYYKETYGEDAGGEFNKFTFEGGMNFLLTLIKNKYNKANILIIGEIENQKLPLVPPKQILVADSWNIPICKLWECLGWSQHTITTTGYWDNKTGLWVESGGEEQQITLLNRFCRDNIHPHSDNSGYALNLIATNISKWLYNIVAMS